MLGGTPLAFVDGIYLKVECVNPCGSIKDRIAKYIIDKSEEQGLLCPGMTIVEATSGNTGIALSHYAREKGYPITIVMPEHMTEERKQIIRDLGATLILNSKEGSFAEAAGIRDEMAKDPNIFSADQFANPLNVECHYSLTGQELIKALPEGVVVDAFVAGVGTGGSLIGIGKALREVFPNVKVIALEPTEANVMSGGEGGTHGIFGIGDGFIPEIASDGQGGVHPMIDEVVCVSTEEAKESALALDRETGLCVGISSGANFLAAQRLKSRFETVVTLLPDGYSKYVSEGITRCGIHDCPYEDRCPGPLSQSDNCK